LYVVKSGTKQEFEGHIPNLTNSDITPKPSQCIGDKGHNAIKIFYRFFYEHCPYIS